MWSPATVRICHNNRKLIPCIVLLPIYMPLLAIARRIDDITDHIPNRRKRYSERFIILYFVFPSASFLGQPGRGTECIYTHTTVCGGGPGRANICRMEGELTYVIFHKNAGVAITNHPFRYARFHTIKCHLAEEFSGCHLDVVGPCESHKVRSRSSTSNSCL